jgi:coenzyme F420-0:L-glutamate ligase/coenzyme F420-1:gamma-L-glutamate ligase
MRSRTGPQRSVISMANNVTVFGLQGFPLVKPGDDIVQLILDSARSLDIPIEDDDVIVVSHKIVSKSEGRIVELSKVKPTARATRVAKRSGKDPRLVQLILNESRRVIKVKPGILLVETKQGIVCLNAGIDKSNVEGRDAYSLLPENPSLSAERIGKRVKDLTGKRVRVIVTDTYSRPFRNGQSEFAIGLSELDPFFDYRGQKDLFGYILKFKFVSVADELASAAELVMGQGAEGIPAAIIRGLTRIRENIESTKPRLTMDRDQDLFRNAL